MNDDLERMWKEAIVALGGKDWGKPWTSSLKITVVPAGIQTEHFPNMAKSVTAMLTRSFVLCDLNRIIDIWERERVIAGNSVRESHCIWKKMSRTHQVWIRLPLTRHHAWIYSPPIRDYVCLAATGWLSLLPNVVTLWATMWLRIPEVPGSNLLTQKPAVLRFLMVFLSPSTEMML
jgi:hypothetical protein